MKYDFSKLEADLIEGNRLAQEKAAQSNDGGTANLDCCFLRLEGARELKVLETIKKAGLYCRTKSKWIGNGYFINPTTDGQGNKRSLGVETMSKHLKACGWECLTYYRMD